VLVKSLREKKLFIVHEYQLEIIMEQDEMKYQKKVHAFHKSERNCRLTNKQGNLNKDNMGVVKLLWETKSR
jgi:hypothetical protein